MIECGKFMEMQARGVGLAPSELARLKELQRRAKLELPHDDPSTPDVDEGDTEIVRTQKRELAMQQRMADLERKLEQLGETLLGKLLDAAPAILIGLTKR